MTGRYRMGFTKTNRTVYYVPFDVHVYMYVFNRPMHILTDFQSVFGEYYCIMHELAIIGGFVKQPYKIATIYIYIYMYNLVVKKFISRTEFNITIFITRFRYIPATPNKIVFILVEPSSVQVTHWLDPPPG